MWIFTTVGFFSIVQKPNETLLTVRSRVVADLDRLRQELMSELTPTISGGGTDYPYRATISHEDFSQGLVKMAKALHYSNFKNEVTKTMGYERASVYSDVWGVLKKLEKDTKSVNHPPSPKHRFKKRQAFGGVVVNDQGKVLLKEPMNHYDNYVWTFPKGRPDPGETPESVALREVFEETGVEAKVVERLPGSFEGGTTENVYFLMTMIKETGKFDKETEAIRWVTFQEAEHLIRKTTNPTGRKRDLQVLKVAFKVLDKNGQSS